MLLIAIDGACRRNGKPDCVSAAGVFIQHFDEYLRLTSTNLLTGHEEHSTNQRGELLALSLALSYVLTSKQSAQIVTDSEYLFNAMTKEWYITWAHNNWMTSTGSSVKNQDLWSKISGTYASCVDNGLEINFYHIKGHCIPFGKVSAAYLLKQDNTGMQLLSEVMLKYSSVCDTTRKDCLIKANELSERNNGFKLPASKLSQFVVSNVVVDAIATTCVDNADMLFNQAAANGS